MSGWLIASSWGASDSKLSVASGVEPSEASTGLFRLSDRVSDSKSVGEFWDISSSSSSAGTVSVDCSIEAVTWLFCLIVVSIVASCSDSFTVSSALTTGPFKDNIAAPILTTSQLPFDLRISFFIYRLLCIHFMYSFAFYFIITFLWFDMLSFGMRGI